MEHVCTLLEAALPLADAVCGPKPIKGEPLLKCVATLQRDLRALGTSMVLATESSPSSLTSCQTNGNYMYIQRLARSSLCLLAGEALTRRLTRSSWSLNAWKGGKQQQQGQQQQLQQQQQERGMGRRSGQGRWVAPLL